MKFSVDLLFIFREKIRRAEKFIILAGVKERVRHLIYMNVVKPHESYFKCHSLTSSKHGRKIHGRTGLDCRGNLAHNL